MNFLKITDRDDKDYYINFDLVRIFSAEDWASSGDLSAEYLIRFEGDEERALKFNDKKDRDNKLALISNFLKLR